MARHKKDGTYLNVRIETSIYNRLNDLCDDAGQTKTTAVERALTEYLDNSLCNISCTFFDSIILRPSKKE